jgi:hypothetical protein
MPDPELLELRSRVDCRTVLEHAGWRLDSQESTRRAAKYRAGPGRIIIITHEGRGWFDPLADGAKGDVIALAKYIWSCNLGHARLRLRPLAGIAPSLVPGPSKPSHPLRNAGQLWQSRRPPQPGSAAWRYLTDTRALPSPLVARAVRLGLVREGVRGTAWFVHRHDDVITGWEMRGPSYKGFVSGGSKGLFTFAIGHDPKRLAVCESAIDALSLAAIEGCDMATAYLSTGGGWGDAGRDALMRLLMPNTVLVAAVDNGIGGDLLAGRLAKLAEVAAVRFDRLRPRTKDWNQELCEI